MKGGAIRGRTEAVGAGRADRERGDGDPAGHHRPHYFRYFLP